MGSTDDGDQVAHHERHPRWRHQTPAPRTTIRSPNEGRGAYDCTCSLLRGEEPLQVSGRNPLYFSWRLRGSRGRSRGINECRFRGPCVGNSRQGFLQTDSSSGIGLCQPALRIYRVGAFAPVERKLFFTRPAKYPLLLDEGVVTLTVTQVEGYRLHCDAYTLFLSLKSPSPHLPCLGGWDLLVLGGSAAQ